MWSPSKIAIERAAGRGTAVSAGIHHPPMVSVAVMLLVVIMVAATSLPHHGRYVDLPRTNSATPQPSARREDAIKVGIGRDGSVFFRNSQIDVKELANRMRESAQSAAERKVYLAVDGRTKCRDAEAVLDQIRTSGITQICFLAERLPD